MCCWSMDECNVGAPQPNADPTGVTEGWKLVGLDLLQTPRYRWVGSRASWGQGRWIVTYAEVRPRWPCWPWSIMPCLPFQPCFCLHGAAWCHLQGLGA